MKKTLITFLTFLTFVGAALGTAEDAPGPDKITVTVSVDEAIIKSYLLRALRDIDDIELVEEGGVFTLDVVALKAEHGCWAIATAVVSGNRGLFQYLTVWHTGGEFLEQACKDMIASIDGDIFEGFRTALKDEQTRAANDRERTQQDAKEREYQARREKAIAGIDQPRVDVR